MKSIKFYHISLEFFSMFQSHIDLDRDRKIDRHVVQRLTVKLLNKHKKKKPRGNSSTNEITKIRKILKKNTRISIEWTHFQNFRKNGFVRSNIIDSIGLKIRFKFHSKEIIRKLCLLVSNNLFVGRVVDDDGPSLLSKRKMK